RRGEDRCGRGARAEARVRPLPVGGLESKPMYEEHFGFREPPFRITPDPRFLYRNPCVEEAGAALAYGIERRKGFLSLVGEAGTGKTTLLRHVLDTLAGNVRTVVLLHPTVEFDE